MSSPVSDPWMVTHPATPSTPDMRKQRRTWHAATPHKVASPADDVPSLQITHFTKKQIVCFDVVKFGKSRKRHLKLINPRDYPQTVELERISPKKGFFLNDKMWEIPPNQELLIPIFWTPPEEGSFRDLITFLCEGAFRLQVILLGTAEDATRKVSGRRSTFLVKRKSLAKPLRTQNGLGQKKKKKHSLQTTPKPVGKENFNSTDVNLPKVDMLPGTQRETMVFKAANATVPTKLKAECKENSGNGRDLNETAFNNRTTCNALKELRNAVEPIQNVPLQNIARETLVVCEGMSPLLQSKKSKARTKKGNYKGSPERGRSSEDFVRELKGTEVKVHHSSSDNHSSPLVVVGVSKRALFTDVEVGKGISDRQPDQDSVITSDADDKEVNEYDSREEKKVNDIHDEDSKDDCDSFEDSLEAKSEGKNASREADSVRCADVPEENGDTVVDADGRGDSGEREEALDSATEQKKEWGMDEEGDIGGGEGGGRGFGQDRMEDDILKESRGTESKVEEEEDENVRPVKVEEGDDEEESDGAKAETEEDTVVGIETLATESEVIESTEMQISCDVHHGVEGMRGIVNELSSGKLEEIESAQRGGENDSREEEAGDTLRASSYSPTDGEVESASPLEDATLDVDVSKITVDDDVRGQHHETTILDRVPAREDEKQGLMFISLDDDIRSRSKKRTSDPDDTGVTAVKKLKTLNSSGVTANKPTKGRKSSSLSLNRTVALRRAAAMNSSVTGGSRTKPKARKAMKGVPMAKLNLLKPAKTALPRHPMPFAAKNMFYDERWIDKQERGFVQWLNYILTPEEEGAQNPTIKGKKIEASALAVSSSSTTIKPAPTKEVLSMRAYTARRRLNQLRRGACMLFQSEPVVRVIQKLEAQVEIGRMTVRTDRKIHADLGMKQNILMMILSYNPLWLRIGLETIYGELLPIEDNSDVIGLSRFIVTRLLGNPDIAEQYSHPTVPGLFGPGYELTLAKFTLKKFLLLVFFLDKAKLTRLIDHNPCLFCKDAQYKSSRDLLLEFSRHYLKGEGDITRHLNYIGFSVTHVQKAIDEFDYAVLNLAKDLRDGIRLVRVTELLTKNWLLSHELRCPAISRLQKVHNVQVALDALTSSAESSVGGVEAKAIVDGHREKTLQLLWSIIFAFKVETMLDEAQLKEETVFLWNNLKLRQKLDAVKMPAQKKTKRPDVTDVYFKSDKLSLLLKWCQAVCAYYGVQVDNFTVSFCDGRAFCYLVHHYHPELISASSIRDQTTHTEALRDESSSDAEDSFDDGNWSRSFSPTCGKDTPFDQLKKNEGENFKTLYQGMKSLGGVPFMIKSSDMSGTIPDEKVVITYVSYLCARLLDLCHETRAVRTIQTAWRSHQLRKKMREREVRRKAATVIQRRVREFLTMQRMRQKISAVVCLQAAARGWLARRKMKALRRKRQEEKETAAAIILQVHVRRHQAQKRRTAQLKALVRLQAFARGIKVRRDVERTRRAVRVIEEHYGAHQQRQRAQAKYQQIRRSVVAIQALARGVQTRKLYQQMKAARRIQAAWRGWVARKAFATDRRAAVIIQSAWRMYNQKRHYRRLLLAVRLIQLRYREVLLGRQERSAFLTKRRSVLKIQSSFRGYSARKTYAKERQHCIHLQALIRGHLERKRFLRLRWAAVSIQRRYRATVLARQETQKYELKRSAVVKLQGLVRGWLVQRDLMERERAVCVLQAWIRGRRQREQYNEMRKACILLQSFVRAHQARRKYLRLQEAALVLQKVYRGQQARMRVREIRSAIKIQATYKMYKARCSYKSEVAKVITCQSVIRCFLQRRKYERLTNSAFVIQRHFRGWRQMKMARGRFAKMKHAAVTIQAAYRGHRARQTYASTVRKITLCQNSVRMFLERKRFERKKNAALVIQERFRAYRLMEEQKAAYERMRRACVVIQSSYRGHICRREYHVYRGSVIVIQSQWRMVKAQRSYQAVRDASLAIQERWRAFLQARSQRRDYLKMRDAATVLQSAYRGLRSRRYAAYLKKVVLCQSLVRRFLVQQKLKEQKIAAVIIQARFRGYAARKSYVEQRKAATVIQQRWRAVLIGREEHLQYHIQRGAVIVIQSVVRSWRARQEFLKAKKSAIVIQSAYRRQRAMLCYQRQRAAVIVLQRYLRAKNEGTETRSSFLEMRQSAIIVQSCWRMKNQRLKYLRKRTAAIAIQTAYRRHRAMVAYKSHKKAVVTLQRFARAYLEGRAVRAEYERTRKSAISIQSWWRMVRERRMYKRKSSAAIAIQTAYRRHRAMEAYKVHRQAVVTLQRFARAYLEGKAVRAEYERTRKSAISIQSWWRMVSERQFYERKILAVLTIQTAFRRYRAMEAYKVHRQAVVTLQRFARAYLEGKAVRAEYERTRKSAIFIQSWWRMVSERQFYEKKISAVLTIQTAFRRYRAMEVYKVHRQAVVTLQRFSRAYLEGKAVRALYERTRKSAISIQSWWRMVSERRMYKRKISAAIKMQAAYRRHLAMEAYKIHIQAVVTLQRFTRAYLEGKLVRAEYEKNRASAISIQSWWRMVSERRCYDEKKAAVIAIQTLYRRHRAMEAYKTSKQAAITLQRFIRAYLEGQVVREQFLKEKQSAVLIQLWWRMLLDRSVYQDKRRAAITIQAQLRMSIELKKYRHDRAVLIAMQRRWRAKNLARVERSHYLAMRKAIATIQAVARGTAVRRRIQLWHACATRIIAQWNGYRQRKAYLRIRNSVTIIQTYYRAAQSMRRERDQYQEQRRSAIVLQSYFRVLKAKRVAQRERAARLIQATYRMHEAQRNYQTLKRSAVTIQAAFRGHRCRDRHLKILRAVGILQKHLRAFLVGCQVRQDLARKQKAALAIQSFYRGCSTRREYLSKREASMKIQTWYRCQRESGLYRRLKSATVVLQRFWRSNLAMRAEIKKYHMTRGAIITVQAQVRCYLLRGRYLRLKKSAVVLQKSWRGHKVRQDNRNRCNAATCIQQHWRARIEGRQERSAYLALKEQVVIIQSIYKARQCRRHFLQQRKAATIVQSWVRAYRSRRRYRVLRSATVTIQRYWRAKRLTDDCRESYLKMKSQVVLVQSLYRARQCRKDYLRKQSAVVLVQAWVRGHRCRQRYRKVKEAAATIHMHWTARKLAVTRRSEFVLMRKAAVSIQSAYRAHRCRQLFLRKKTSAMVIQAWYRGQKTLRHFRTTRSAAVVIQRWYRSVLLARRIKREYEKMSTAAVIVQSFWRGHLARKRAELLRWEIAVAKEKMDALVKIQRWTQSRLQRLRYLHLCRATLMAQRLYKKRYQRRTEASVILQSYARMWLAKKMIRDRQRAALTLQSIWRGRKVRRANKNKKVAKARVRCLKATRAATEDKKLCNRTTSALHFLLTYKHLHQIVEAVSSLEVATRLSSRCCERLVAGQAVPVLFCLIRNCNRSLPCMEVIKHVVATLTNLAKYHVTAPAVLDCAESVTGILDLMMIYRETNTLIATKATMLLTVLAQDNNLKLVIVTTPKVEEKLCSLLHLQERKQKLKTRQMIAKSKSKGLATMNQSALATPSKRPRPPKTFQPDWILGRHKRPDIEDPLEALKCLMNSLNVK